MHAAHDRSRSTQWEGAHGMVLPEVDPTDETALDAHKATQPERRLLLAILADAIVRCRRLATAPRHASIELREAERWVRSDDREWPCSFVNVCEALDIAHGPLRRAVLAWRRTSGNRVVTRRGLLVKNKRRRRSAAAVAACVSADAAASGSAASASSVTSDPTPASSSPTVALA
jgi:hypothetical protein